MRSQVQELSEKLQASDDMCQKLKKERTCLKYQLYQKSRKDFVNHLVSSDKMCKHYTGFPYVFRCKAVFHYLDPGEEGENIIFGANCKERGDDRGRPRMLSPFDGYLLTLCRLRCNMNLQHLSYLFDASQSTVSSTIITWVNFIYLKLGMVNIWPDRTTINDNMPMTMKAKFPFVCVIVDRTEVYAEVPQSLVMHKLLHSDYKSHVTIKNLVGIMPGGGFTFISPAFPGSYSDRGIVLQSGILYPCLWGKGDVIMADRGFTVQDLFGPLGVSVIMPNFLKGRDQFTKEETVMNQQIASERIHVERMIEKLKNFHIFDSPIPVTMFGSVNQIITVHCFVISIILSLLQKETSNLEKIKLFPT